jgi:hypothetical protein
MRPASLPAVLLAISLLAAEARACSQCLCGTPFPAEALGGAVPMQLRYGFEERYLSKSNALDEEPGTESEREHRVSGFVLWRAADRLALLARLPYNVKELTESPAGGENRIQTARGVGDAEALGLIGLAHTRGPRAFVLGLVLGVTAPTGSNGLEDDTGARLEEHLQPGSGAWSGTAGLNVAADRGAGLFDGGILGRANSTNSHGYRYGNALLFNAGYTSPGLRGVRLIAQVNGRAAGRDEVGDGTLDENTGGTVIYLSPGARWRTGLGLDVEGAVQFPVVESLFGIQDEHTTGRIALSLSR